MAESQHLEPPSCPHESEYERISFRLEKAVRVLLFAWDASTNNHVSELEHIDSAIALTRETRDLLLERRKRVTDG